MRKPKRFWSKVDVGNPDECWEWISFRDSEGFGHFSIKGRQYYSHRVAWYLTFGRISKGLCVCHHCDNPSCVTPSHLFLGTQRDNLQDASRKGHWGKLTADDVREIREILSEGDWSRQEIADAFGVRRSHISRIKRGKKWAWEEASIS